MRASASGEYGQLGHVEDRMRLAKLEREAFGGSVMMVSCGCFRFMTLYGLWFRRGGEDFHLWTWRRRAAGTRRLGQGCGGGITSVGCLGTAPVLNKSVQVAYTPAPQFLPISWCSSSPRHHATVTSKKTICRGFHRSSALPESRAKEAS